MWNSCDTLGTYCPSHKWVEYELFFFTSPTLCFICYLPHFYRNVPRSALRYGGSPQPPLGTWGHWRWSCRDTRITLLSGVRAEARPLDAFSLVGRTRALGCHLQSTLSAFRSSYLDRYPFVVYRHRQLHWLSRRLHCR